ncbi:MAG TPA: sulfite exporter TauE/SafE family protein [Ignavibacteriaceae bacterium]|nr:sulfite exporter TauE/SafE family protein [Ignavibacteriaceae bacterium]
MLELLGFFSAVLIGISLGLIGSGGSILTVPVLVYLFNIEPVMATAYSLFIVGLTAFVGSLRYMKEQLLDYKTAIVFSIPAFVAVFISRMFIIPFLPEVVISLNGYSVLKGTFLLIVFAVLMIMASFSMIRDKKPELNFKEIKFNYPLIFVEGFIVGLLTGLVGAGGGFLIIPALVLLAKLPMKIAVGTSLLIIALKSLIGFTGDIGSGQMINWLFLFEVSSVAITGIFIGFYLSKKISGAKLKPFFGWFVLAMGIYIIIKETF